MLVLLGGPSLNLSLDGRYITINTISIKPSQVISPPSNHIQKYPPNHPFPFTFISSLHIRPQEVANAATVERY